VRKHSQNNPNRIGFIECCFDLSVMEQRLQKLIAQAGIASRRHAEQMITAGEVTVNGKVITELGTKADPQKDHIKVRGKLINPVLQKKQNVYVLLNKPRGYLSSVSDPEQRPLVTELLPASLGKLHPVGRLDFNTEGLLLLTNDGAFTNFVTAARNQVAKIYEARVKGIPPEYALQKLRTGVVLEDGSKTAPAEISLVKSTDLNAWFEVILHEGRNQQIRRMFDSIGYSVIKLRRVRIGPLSDERLKPGEWRLLTPAEVNRVLKGKAAIAPSRRAGKRLASHGSGRR
jgi:23S rRNA pseudouridine2605 synthase